jgi:hypothetical protein
MTWSSTRAVLAAAAMTLGPASPALAQAALGLGRDATGLRLEVPAYPQLVRVPGHPVHYDPSGSSNYFFYDGLFWVYRDDAWYSSAWYNGPWQGTEPDQVPLSLLRVPLRYYRQPSLAFSGWRPEASPRWGLRWGPEWARRHPGWDRFDRRGAPPPAPLPAYQQAFRGDRYPWSAEQQYALRARNYRYAPLEPFSRERLEIHERGQAARASTELRGGPDGLVRRHRQAEHTLP